MSGILYMLGHQQPEAPFVYIIDLPSLLFSLFFMKCLPNTPCHKLRNACKWTHTSWGSSNVQILLGSKLKVVWPISRPIATCYRSMSRTFPLSPMRPSFSLQKIGLILCSDLL